MRGFLVSNKIEYKEKALSPGYPVPEPDGKRYKATGMKKAEVIDVFKKASFFGFSTDYEIGIDKEHLNLIKQLYPDWTIKP